MGPEPAGWRIAEGWSRIEGLNLDFQTLSSLLLRGGLGVMRAPPHFAIAALSGWMGVKDLGWALPPPWTPLTPPLPPTALCSGSGT